MHKPFGWSPPLPVNFVFAYCPEMIAAQTADLCDEEVREYLVVLGFCVAMHIQHHELSPGDRERMIDRTLYDIGPASMELMNLVHQMRVIDMRTEGS